MDLSDSIKKVLRALGLWPALKNICLVLRSYGCNLLHSQKTLSRLYSKDYFARCHYSTDHPQEGMIKDSQAEFIIRAVKPKKVLVAGCAAGELIRSLRAKGVECWGFDFAPDLGSVAYPDVAHYLRPGSLTAIPFECADGFDVFVAFDVFEHVLLKDIDRMIAEIDRLAPVYLVTIIAHGFIDIGHVTLMPLVWWQRKFAKHYALFPVRVDTEGIAKVYGIDDADSPIRIWRRRRD